MVMPTDSDSVELAPITCPKARIWAAAQKIEPGSSISTTSFSTPGEKRSRNRSANVVNPLAHSGPASAMPTANSATA